MDGYKLIHPQPRALVKPRPTFPIVITEKTMIKRQLKIDDSHNLFLSNLPYSSGQKLTVIIMAEDELQQRQMQWKSFFKQLQAMPVAQNLTEDDIMAEIEAYRSENNH